MAATTDIVPALSPDAARDLVRERYGLTGDLKALPSYADQNFRLRTDSGEEWVVKIVNGATPRALIEAQIGAMAHLEGRLDDVAVPRVRPALSGERLVSADAPGGQRHLAYLLSFLPGRMLVEYRPLSRQLLASLGHLVALVDRGLADFSHPATHGESVWDVPYAPQVRPLIRHILPLRRRYLVERYLAEVEDRVLPRLDELPAGMIHNDGNDYNVLVTATDDGPRATGLIDFGDMVHSRRVFGLAVAAAYAVHGADDLLGAAAAVTAGYHRLVPLREVELEVLLPAILARMTTSVTVCADERRKQPDNAYVAANEATNWDAMERLAGVDAEVARRRFAEACEQAKSRRAVTGRSAEEILDLRRRHLGPSFSVSYRQPLKITRGYMQYLFDDAGRAYLDGVNNVCHVGHCHPRVVAAAQRQMERLNTNTRYLHDHLAEYAERLTATLPEPLSVCYFVCTGSEANDLALRLARAHSGRRGVVVVDGAYHGHTGDLIELSPYKYDGPGGSGRADHVRAVTMPDGFRQAFKRSDPEAGRKYADHVAAAVADLERSPHGVAAFFCESLLGCGGQVVPPPGYLEHAFRHVRRAGGVCVADEVQVGFGRAGSHFWAFEAQGVVPDVVTLGKPIGNGHPLAAVVTTAEIAASFAGGMEYFNTFGGNPVSCAVGLAVLDVLAEEELQAHADVVGRHLASGLETLAAKHPLIGDVRGLGLFLGVELVRDREQFTPAAAEAEEVVEGLKERGVLLATDGPLHNVLKIKPPLPFSTDNADRLVAALDEVLGELAEDGTMLP